MNTHFNNQAFECVGSGRLGLALDHEYLEELALVQRELGFKRIRFHGLFHDDVGIYQQHEDEQGNVEVEYNYTYLDRIFDSFQRLHINPCLETGFMPAKLASGPETFSYWQGHITPPNNEQRWLDLVTTTLKHLVDRYGETVYTWPIEIWNEPNIDQFWSGDEDDYLHFFAITFNAIKQLDDRFIVGGPAICGVQDEKWIKDFLAFCEKENLHPDFITRHFYTVSVVPTAGHYRYPELRDLKESLHELETSRKLIDQSSLKGLPMYITEFSTSYSPDAPLHDTVKNAAYVADMLSKMGDTCELYSYWTFGDVFEEKGIPYQLFHGGFGLLADHQIKKPTYWTYVFYKQLLDHCTLKNDHAVVTNDDQGCQAGVVWNYRRDHDVAPYYYDIKQDQFDSAVLTLQLVDQKHGNPLKTWHDLGEPANPQAADVKLIKQAASPEIKTVVLHRGESYSLAVSADAVVGFTVKPRSTASDRGFDYTKLTK